MNLAPGIPKGPFVNCEHLARVNNHLHKILKSSQFLGSFSYLFPSASENSDIVLRVGVPTSKGTLTITKLLSQAVALLAENLKASFISWDTPPENEFVCFQYGVLGQNLNSEFDGSIESAVKLVGRNLYSTSATSSLKKKYLHFDIVEFIKKLLLDKRDRESPISSVRVEMFENSRYALVANGCAPITEISAMKMEFMSTIHRICSRGTCLSCIGLSTANQVQNTEELGSIPFQYVFFI